MPDFWAAVVVVAGMVQAVCAIALIIATFRYVGLTAELTKNATTQLELLRRAHSSTNEYDSARLWAGIQRLMATLRNYTNPAAQTERDRAALWSAEDEQQLLDGTLRVAPGLNSEANEAVLLLRAIRLQSQRLGASTDQSLHLDSDEGHLTARLERAFELLGYLQEVVFPDHVMDQRRWRAAVRTDPA